MGWMGWIFTALTRDERRCVVIFVDDIYCLRAVFVSLLYTYVQIRFLCSASGLIIASDFEENTQGL